MLKEEEKKSLTIREKIVLTLFVFIVQMLKPYSYDHEFEAYWQEIKDLMNK